jgi:hypothetical protein
MTEIKTDHTMLLCAFRYALGRRSYIVSMVIDEIRKNFVCLPKFHLELMSKEIEEAIKDDMAGDECDVQKWEWLKKEIEEFLECD